MNVESGGLLTPDFIITETLKVYEALWQLRRQVGPEVFSTRSITTENKQQRTVIEADAYAEFLLSEAIRARLKGRARILRATTLDDGINLSKERRLCVIVDAIDGADIYVGGLTGWGTAIVVFDPISRTVLSSFVASPPKNLLYFTSSEGGSFRIRLTTSYAPNLPSTVNIQHRQDRDEGLLVAMESARPVPLRELVSGWDGRNESWLQRIQEPCVTNLLMTELVEGTLDVVIARGHNVPHDVLAGAILASAAGAYITFQDGTECDLNGLILSLMRPGLPVGRNVLVGRNEKACAQVSSLPPLT